MARLLAFLLFISGAVQSWFDWQTTIAIAEPFRFTKIAIVWDELHPGSFAKFGEVVPTLMGVPLAPTLFGLAVVFWIFRQKH